MDIDSLIENAANEILSEKTAKKSQDQGKKGGYESQRKNKTNKQGRKNHGLTNRHKEEHKRNYAKYQNDFLNTKNSTSFNSDIIEKVQGEVIQENDLNGFQECLELTFESVLEDFKRDNEELSKKHPYNWHKQLLMEVKKNVPKVSIEDIDKLEIVWRVLSNFLFTIGLHPSMEVFFLFTNTYKYQYERRKELNPKYGAFLENIYEESKTSLLCELTNNPYNQTNKIFLAKSLYGIVEHTEPKQIEVRHKIQNIDDIPIFGNEQNANQ